MKSLHITIGVPVLAALCGVLIGMAMTTDPTWSAVPCDAQAGQMLVVEPPGKLEVNTLGAWPAGQKLTGVAE